MSQPADIEELSGESPSVGSPRRIAAVAIIAATLMVAFIAGRATAPTTSAAATPAPAASRELVRPAWVSDALLQAYYEHPSSTSACTASGGVSCLALLGTRMDHVAWQGALDGFWPRVQPQTVRAGRIVVAAPLHPGPTGKPPVLVVMPEQGSDSQPDGTSPNGNVWFFDLGELPPGWYALITTEEIGPPTGVLATAFGIIVR
jgi:hypothetical protein